MKDADGWNLERYHATLRVADVNGDGKADLCARAALGLRCYGFASGAFAQVLASTALADADGRNASTRYETVAFADVNGDGRADACARGSEGYGCWPTTGDTTGAFEGVDEYSDAQGWDEATYFASLRLAGPSAKRVAPPGDAGAPDAGSPAADAGIRGADAGDDGGCGCTVVGTRRKTSTAIGVIAMLAGMVLRRRRRAQSA
jgi:MYXO-CTERM domain-containing protein